MIAIIDYGAGNLQSVQKALHFLQVPSTVASTADVIQRADGIILPGVGAFADAMDALRQRSLAQTVAAAAAAAATGGKPFLGICLGLQLLFAGSAESPGAEGLGILPGKIREIPADGVKVPHIGWNSLQIHNHSGLFSGITQDSYSYFVHSYYLHTPERELVAATTEYAVAIDAAIAKENLFACQFHPEKSGDCGLQMLQNFVTITHG